MPPCPPFNPTPKMYRNFLSLCSLLCLAVSDLLCAEVVEVTASGFQSGNEPAHAIDGNPNSRWSAEGKGQWLQLKLD